MPKAYFDPHNMNELAEVFRHAEALLTARGQEALEIRDKVARRIFELAAKGTPPQDILSEVIPMSAGDAGLPDSNPGDRISASQPLRV